MSETVNEILTDHYHHYHLRVRIDSIFVTGHYRTRTTCAAVTVCGKFEVKINGRMEHVRRGFSSCERCPYSPAMWVVEANNK